jgi:hypothetical protein
MASYSYGKKTRVRRSGVKAVGPTSAELEASMAKYKLPPGPRGDNPGGVTGGQDQGRTGDMRFSSQYTGNVRKNPSAPFGRYENGQPMPEVLPSTRGGETVPIPSAGRRRQRVIPKNHRMQPKDQWAFEKQKGWRS